MVRIYSRRSCSLCDKVLAVVEGVAARFPIEIEVIDIDLDAELRSEYDTEVPVVEVNDREISRYHLTEAQLVRALENQNPGK